MCVFQLRQSPTFRNVATSQTSVLLPADTLKHLRSEEVSVQVVLLTELVCDWDAGEVLTPLTLHRVDVEENSQGGEQTQEDQQEDTDLDPLTVHVSAPETEEEQEESEHYSSHGVKGAAIHGHILTVNPSQRDRHPSLHLPDVRQEGKGQEESRYEAADVGKVVNPWKQTKGEEED